MDAASEAGVDDVRERIVDVVQYKPALCRFKVFIIDEVHDLSSKAFDALLKTLEEPPSHIVFILATTELHKVPPTIQSRCQRFAFHRASVADLVQRIEFVLTSEGVSFEPAAVGTIARMADGGFRDALTLAEQVIGLSTDGVTLDGVYEQLGLVREDIIDALLLQVQAGDIPKILETVEQTYRTGRDARAILEGCLHRLAVLTRARYLSETSQGIDAAEEASLRSIATQFPNESLVVLREAFANWLKDIRDVSLPRTWLESKLIGYAIKPPPVVAQQPAQQPASQPMSRPPKPVAAVQAEIKPPAPKPVVTSLEGPAQQAAIVWNEVVNLISSKSKAAAGKLVNSEVIALEEEVVRVQFARAFDRDWVLEKQGLMPMIREEFTKRMPGHWEFDFKVEEQKKNNAGSVMDSAVELPAEGELLIEIATRQLENF